MAAEINDPAVGGLLVAGQHPERGVLPASLLELAGAGHPGAVCMGEHHHHPRLLGLLSTGFLMAVAGVDLIKIEL